jgi:hypothetical protein
MDSMTGKDRCLKRDNTELLESIVNFLSLLENKLFQIPSDDEISFSVTRNGCFNSIYFVETLVSLILSVFESVFDFESHEARHSELERNVERHIDFHRESVNSVLRRIERMNERLSNLENEFNSRMTKIENDLLNVEMHSKRFEDCISKSGSNLSTELNVIEKKQNENQKHFVSVCENVKVIESKIVIIG